MKARKPIPKYSVKRLAAIEAGTASPYLKRTPIQRTAPVKRVADKRDAELELYYSIDQPEFLAEHKECEICPVIEKYRLEGSGKIYDEVKWWPTCSGKAKEVHHTAGRTNDLLRAREHFMASCDSKGGRSNGHNWIKEHSAAAMLIGVIKRRVT